MFKSTIYMSLIVLMTHTLLYAKTQTKEPKPELFKAQWQKIYGGSEDDTAKAVVMLEEGDVAIVGTCKSFNASRKDICITRLTKEGHTKWRKLIEGAKEDKGIDITRSRDGNLLILGEGKSFNKNADQDLFVAKLSLNGDLIWQSAFGGDRDEFAGGIAGTNDGGALIVGDSESFSKKGIKDIYIVRLNKEGKLLSEAHLGGSKTEEAKALSRTADGNFVMVGSREVDRAGDADFFLLKLNQKGKTLWAKNVGGKYDDVLHAVTPTPDGGIVTTGVTRSYGSEQTDLSVLRFTKEGKLLWHKIYGFEYYDEGHAVTMTKDGGFMIAGATNSMGKGDFDVYTIALNKKGSLVWSNLYGGTNRDIARGITRTTDGGLIIVGESDSYKRNKQFYMLKLK
jgi:uncharacterized delta-60 repeat protein